MLLSYEEYAGLGYDKVPEKAFREYELKARGILNDYTLNRISKLENLDEDTQIVVAIVINELYMDETEQRVLSVHNDGYSESYAPQTTANEKIENLIMSMLPPSLTNRRI